MSALPTVVIIGRPNVGKSTLFNRMVGTRQAIVTSTAGTTRDRIYGNADWRGHYFQLIDTGGWMPESSNTIEQLINQQIIIALKESDILLFICNEKDGCTSLDKELAQVLRKYNKTIYLCINKVDSSKKSHLIDSDFYGLGFDNVFAISAEHGLGLDDLLDSIINRLPAQIQSAENDHIKVAIVGRPNVGKSSLINALLGKERLIISETPGTTRDSIDITFQHKNTHYCLIDTAGIKKKAKAQDIPELISIIKAKQSIERADVVLLVLDSTKPVQHLEASIAGFAYQKCKPTGLVINKIDLHHDSRETRKLIKQDISDNLPFIAYAPSIFVSAKTLHNISGIMKLTDNLYGAYTYRIPTHELNDIFNKELKDYTLGQFKNRPIKIKYITQVATKPPAYAVFANRRTGLKANQIKHLENIIRKYYDFMRIPMIFSIRLTT
jgi:GTPase